MKKLATILHMLGATLSAADYSGTYTGRGGREDPRYGTDPRSAQLTLLQAGSSFSGSLKIGNSSPMPISSGTVNGTQLTFVVSTGGHGRITGLFSQNGAVLSGKMTASTGQIYDFVFTKN